MDRDYGRHGREYHTVRKRNHLEDKGAYWRIMFEINLKEIGWDSVSSVHLAQDREKWSDDVNVVRTFVFRKTRGISGLADDVSDSQGLSDSRSAFVPTSYRQKYLLCRCRTV